MPLKVSQLQQRNVIDRERNLMLAELFGILKSTLFDKA
jgi:hypothetical protein